MIFCITCDCGHRFPVCLWKSFLHSDTRELYCPACRRKHIIMNVSTLWQRFKRALRTFLTWLRKKTDLKGYLRRRRERKKRAERLKVLFYDLFNEPYGSLKRCR